MGPRKFKRCRRYNEPGHAHFLTFTCFRGQPFLNKDRTRHWLADALAGACDQHQFHLWAWVFMPEHVHALVWPTQAAYSISAFLTSLKQPVSQRARAYLAREAPAWIARMSDVQPNGKTFFRFWQRGGGYDKNVDDPRDIWDLIDYIHRNPVRRGLVTQPEDWLWSSAGDYLLGQPGRVRIHRESVPRDLRQLGM